MVTDLVQIERLGEKKRAENEAFRKHLKRHGFVEKKFRHIAEEIEDATDCTVCANCCRVATVRLHERDVEKLAKTLRLKEARFLADYTETSEEEGVVLKRDQNGCVFLAGKLCSIYEDRPHNCRNFPHLMRGEGSLISRMWDMPDRATYCPIVYNSLERFKQEVKFPAS